MSATDLTQHRANVAASETFEQFREHQVRFIDGLIEEESRQRRKYVLRPIWAWRGWQWLFYQKLPAPVYQWAVLVRTKTAELEK